MVSQPEKDSYDRADEAPCRVARRKITLFAQAAERCSSHETSWQYLLADVDEEKHCSDELIERMQTVRNELPDIVRSWSESTKTAVHLAANWAICDAQRTVAMIDEITRDIFKGAKLKGF
jgi:hypothetical protein